MGLETLSASEMARRIRREETTCEAIMEDCLARIEVREGDIGAFQYIDPERAIERARAADRSGPSGPLHGVPFAIKDIIDTDDMPTGWGFPAYADRRPARNARCVDLFLRAGAIPVGKTVTTEFAYFRPGKTANPHNVAHTPGGSSSGSAAAVADFMVPVAFGSQTAASLIRPAAYCGVLGYKPTKAAFDLQGVMGLAPSLDTLGLLSRSIADLALARSVLCGGNADVPEISDDDAPRISLMRGPHWHEGSMDMRDACVGAMRKLEESGADTAELAHPALFAELTECQKTIMAFEAARLRRDEYHRYRDEISDAFALLVEEGLATSREKYEAAQRAATRAMGILDMFFMDTDAILAPAAPGEAPEGLGATGDPLFSRAWNLLQVPCISIPFGTGTNGLPLSVQLIGRHRADEKLLATAAWVLDRLGKA